jgi:hypothetical protein
MSMAENMEQELDCELINIIVKVPENTVACKFTATMITDDGKLQDAEMKMNATEFRQARQDFLENVDGGDDYDAMYTLTEKAKRELGVEE